MELKVKLQITHLNRVKIKKESCHMIKIKISKKIYLDHFKVSIQIIKDNLSQIFCKKFLKNKKIKNIDSKIQDDTITNNFKT